MKTLIYVLIGLGFAGLIAAHEVAPTSAAPDTDMTLPFILAAVGTLAFIAAGILAYRLMKASK